MSLTSLHGENVSCCRCGSALLVLYCVSCCSSSSSSCCCCCCCCSCFRCGSSTNFFQNWQEEEEEECEENDSEVTDARARSNGLRCSCQCFQFESKIKGHSPLIWFTSNAPASREMVLAKQHLNDRVVGCSCLFPPSTSTR